MTEKQTPIPISTYEYQELADLCHDHAVEFIRLYESFPIFGAIRDNLDNIQLVQWPSSLPFPTGSMLNHLRNTIQTNIEHLKIVAMAQPVEIRVSGQRFSAIQVDIESRKNPPARAFRQIGGEALWKVEPWPGYFWKSDE